MLEPSPSRHRSTRTIDLPFIVYLLHLQFPAGSCLHYVGSTYKREFGRRMRSHASGYGTSRTKVHYDAGAEFWLVKTWQAPTRELERLLLKMPDLSPYCAICSPPLPLPGSSVRPMFRIDGAGRPERNTLDLSS